jgi:hypothetical protein
MLEESTTPDLVELTRQFEIELREVLDLGQGVVFSVTHQTARLMGSEGSVRETYAATTEIGSEGLAARIVLALDIDEARTAAERLAQERA